MEKRKIKSKKSKAKIFTNSLRSVLGGKHWEVKAATFFVILIGSGYALLWYPLEKSWWNYLDNYKKAVDDYRNAVITNISPLSMILLSDEFGQRHQGNVVIDITYDDTISIADDTPGHLLALPYGSGVVARYYLYSQIPGNIDLAGYCYSSRIKGAPYPISPAYCEAGDYRPVIIGQVEIKVHRIDSRKHAKDYFFYTIFKGDVWSYSGLDTAKEDEKYNIRWIENNENEASLVRFPPIGYNLVYWEGGIWSHNFVVSFRAESVDIGQGEPITQDEVIAWFNLVRAKINYFRGRWGE